MGMSVMATRVRHLVINDRIAVRVIEPDDKTPGGIILPGGSTTDVVRGVVVAAGQGRMTHDGSFRGLVVSVDDTVLFLKVSGTEVTVPAPEGKTQKLTVLHENQVLMILKD